MLRRKNYTSLILIFMIAVIIIGIKPLSSFAMPQLFTRVEEEDTDPSVSATKIKFPNSSETDNGDGSVSISFDIAGGWTYTDPNHVSLTDPNDILIIGPTIRSASNIAIDAFNAAAHSEVDIINSDGTYNTALKVNGIEIIASDGASQFRYQQTSAKTDNYSVTTSDLGVAFTMNASVAKTFTLPSVGASEDGALAGPFTNLGDGQMIIDAADSDYIHDSGAGDTIYTDDGDDRPYPSISLQYIHSVTTWVIHYTSPGSTFTTTD